MTIKENRMAKYRRSSILRNDIPLLVKAQFRFIIFNRGINVKYKRTIPCHIIKIMEDLKEIETIKIPIHDRITISKLSMIAVNVLKNKEKFRYENNNQTKVVTP